MLLPRAPDFYRFDYRFHPVGQGLFASGAVHLSYDASGFRWVYDCGTSSSQKLIDREISRIGPAGDSALDLVVVSHFDHDHISGLCRLLKRYKVSVLMLPYVPLWQRLVIAFQHKTAPQHDHMAFYVDPAGFIGGLRGPDGESSVERIVFVRSSPEEGAELPFEENLGSPDFPPWKLNYATETAPEEEFEFGRPPIAVDFLRRGDSLRIEGLWEFVPYNDQSLAPDSPCFASAVDKHRQDLLTARDDKLRAAALSTLKKAYDRQFGIGSFKRNIISMFLYCGPVDGGWDMAGLRRTPQLEEFSAGIWRKWFDPRPRWDRRGEPDDHQFLRHYLDRLSVLYTGDGYLDSRDRLDALIRHLRRERMSRVAVFQVMHHGASGNCFPGLASFIEPRFSVFSSDPLHLRFRHPHKSVVSEFLNFGPIQVSKNRGVAFDGRLTPIGQ